MTGLTDKTLAERVFHAVSYELIAVLICTPLFAWIMDQPIERMGILNTAISLIAVVWNMVVTRAQDSFLAARSRQKTWAVRLAHGFAFEGGLMVAAVVLTAWWLQVGYWRAFVFDAGLLLFFVPYAVVYNWGYDLFRRQMRGPCG